MKIKRFRPTPDPEKAPDGSRTYSSPTRFPKLSELLSLYEATIKLRGSQNAWNNILKQWERCSYSNGQGNPVMPNFGMLRSKVSQKLVSYVDFATERNPWNRITTDAEGAPSEQMTWSEHITHAFQKYCIKKWWKSFSEFMLASKDMLLFSKGAFVCLDESSPYPESVSIANVWPDANAGMFPESFDVLFVQHRFTAVELFRKVEYSEYVEDGPLEGWRREAVLRIIRGNNSYFKDHNLDSVFQRFKENRVSAQIQDHVIDVVYAFVKEYKRQSTDDGYDVGVSKYVFPTRGFISKKKQGNAPANADDADTQGYLYYKSHCIKCMDEVISLVASTVCRNFYDDPSYAQMIYVTAKTYDMVMNRILQAVEDNMRVYLSSSSTEVMNKLKRMRHGIFQVLDPDVKLVQERIVRPIGEAAQTLRMVTAAEDSRQGEYSIGSSALNKEPKTARQSDIDLSESTKIDGAELKIFNQFVTLMMRQLYRRFTTQEKSDTDWWKGFAKFKKYLKRKNVPDRAWSYEELDIDSILVPGAGSPAYKLQSARIIREALSIPAASPGERLVARRMIAAAEGVDNVEAFLPPDEEYAINEDSLIGVENDILSSPGANPKNAVVVANQLHFRHIPRHIEDAEQSLMSASRLFQSISEFAKEDEGIYLKTITDIVIGVDTKLAHTHAHIQIASRMADKEKIQQLKAWAVKIGEINKDQDKLEEVLNEVQQKRIQESRERNGIDPEVQHRQTMYALEEEHTANMLAFDMQKAQSKAEQLRRQSTENTLQKQALQTVETRHKMNLETIKTGAKVRIEQIKSSSKQPVGRNGKEAPKKKASN